MNYGTQFSEMEPTYMQVWGWDPQTMLFVTHALSFLEQASDPHVVERVFDYVSGLWFLDQFFTFIFV